MLNRQHNKPFICLNKFIERSCGAKNVNRIIKYRLSDQKYCNRRYSDD